MFSLFNFSSIFPGGGQLTQFAPMCGRPWNCTKPSVWLMSAFQTRKHVTFDDVMTTAARLVVIIAAVMLRAVAVAVNSAEHLRHPADAITSHHHHHHHQQQQQQPCKTASACRAASANRPPAGASERRRRLRRQTDADQEPIASVRA